MRVLSSGSSARSAFLAVDVLERLPPLEADVEALERVHRHHVDVVDRQHLAERRDRAVGVGQHLLLDLRAAVEQRLALFDVGQDLALALQDLDELRPGRRCARGSPGSRSPPRRSPGPRPGCARRSPPPRSSSRSSCSWMCAAGTAGDLETRPPAPRPRPDRRARRRRPTSRACAIADRAAGAWSRCAGRRAARARTSRTPRRRRRRRPPADPRSGTGAGSCAPDHSVCRTMISYTPICLAQSARGLVDRLEDGRDDELVILGAGSAARGRSPPRGSGPRGPGPRDRSPPPRPASPRWVSRSWARRTRRRHLLVGAGRRVADQAELAADVVAEVAPRAALDVEPVERAQRHQVVGGQAEDLVVRRDRLVLVVQLTSSWMAGDAEQEVEPLPRPSCGDVGLAPAIDLEQLGELLVAGEDRLEGGQGVQIVGLERERPAVELDRLGAVVRAGPRRTAPPWWPARGPATGSMSSRRRARPRRG